MNDDHRGHPLTGWDLRGEVEIRLLRVVGTEGRLPGPAPDRRSYGSWVSFSDPDGNGWMVQEVTARLPGRGMSNFDIPSLRALLQEAETAHGNYERSAPKHHWSDWYAAYMVARQAGRGPEQAAQEGAQHGSRER